MKTTKQKPTGYRNTTPYANQAMGPRCARCNEAGRTLVPDHTGTKICGDCADELMNPYRSRGVVTDEPWHITKETVFTEMGGGLSPDAAYLNRMLMAIEGDLTRAFAMMTSSMQEMHRHIDELETQVKEQHELIKDLIEELSE